MLDLTHISDVVFSNNMGKSKQKTKLKTNSCHGTPGTRDFQSKLPKNVTINSLKAISYFEM